MSTTQKNITILKSENICTSVEAVCNVARQKAKNCTFPTFVIVPDRFTLECEKLLLQSGKNNQCLLNTRVLTFSMLFNVISTELGTSQTVLDKTKAVLYMWRYIKRLGRREIVIPNDIEELALKARFSQHRMTEEERASMASYANRLVFEISNNKGEYGRLWLKYIRALC